MKKLLLALTFCSLFIFSSCGEKTFIDEALEEIDGTFKGGEGDDGDVPDPGA